MNFSPGTGLKASRTTQAWGICSKPRMVLTAKNNTMIGPKNAATPAVPRLCTTNRAIRMTSVAGSTYGARPALTCFKPSSADRTEIAGVIIASPENNAAPATPSRKTAAVCLPSAVRASASSERIPPSPLLSACMRNTTYLAVTTIRSAQTISETVPTTSETRTPVSLNCPSAVWSA